MALREDQLTFLPTRIFGVEKQPVSLLLQIDYHSVPEDLSPLTVSFGNAGGAAGAPRTPLRVAFKASEINLWLVEVEFPSSGALLTRIEWHGRPINGGDDVATMIESGERVSSLSRHLFWLLRSGNL